MKKITLIFPFLSLLLMPTLSFAGTILTAPNVGLSVTSTLGFLCYIVNIMFTLLIILAVIFVLWAAWTYLQAGGNPSKLSEAGNRLLYAAIAVAVGILATSLPSLVASFLTGNTGAVSGAC